MSQSIFESMGFYGISLWKKEDSRKFTEQEIASIEEAIIAKGEFSKALRLRITKLGEDGTPVTGYVYISLDTATKASIGDIIDPKDVELVSLKYVGSDEERKGKHILRARIVQSEPKEPTFDNPFGL